MKLDVKPPTAHAAEMALLAALLQSNGAYWSIHAELTPDKFADIRFGAFFESIRDSIEAGKDIGPQLLGDKFPGDLELILDIGGAIALASAVPSYADAIVDRWSRRRVIELASEASIRAADLGDDDPADWLEGQLNDLAQGRDAGKGLQTALSAVDTAISDSEEIARGERPPGILTGLGSLNAKIGGLRPGQFVVIAGRTSMGKTAFGIDIADRAASAGHVVAYFSLEMSAADIGEILLARRTGIPALEIARGSLDKGQFDSLARARGMVEKLPLHIDDSPGLGLRAIRSRSRRLQNRDGLGLIVVDYLQMMRAARGDHRPRYELLGEISRGCKELAKELGVPVLALAQVSRAVESRDNKRPTLADLRESGDIEQDSDLVLFLYREEYYLERRKPDAAADPGAYADWLAEAERFAGVVELIIAKQRKGPVGTTAAKYDPASGIFKDRGESLETIDMGV